MSLASPSASYADVLRVPAAARLFGAALLGRLSYGVVFLALMLSLTSTSGSYAVAGAITALFGVTSSFVAPFRARLIDLYGPRRALPPMALVYAALLLALAVGTWGPGTSKALLAVLAAAAGASAPPLGPTMRSLWSELVPTPSLRQRAFTLDTVAEEVLYVTGPLLAGLFAAVLRPAAGLVASAVLLITGSLLLVLLLPEQVAAGHRSRRDERQAEVPPSVGESGARRRRLEVPLRGPVVVSAGLGLALGALSLLIVVFAQQRHQSASVAWVEAALSVGSAAGGLLYGARTWRMSSRVQMHLLVAAVGAVIAVAGFMPDLYVLTAAVGLLGLFVAPTITMTYLLADECSTAEARTRTGTLVNSAYNAGTAVGTACIGLLVGRNSLTLCFAFAALPAVLAATTGMLRTGQPPAPADGSPTEPAAETASVG